MATYAIKWDEKILVTSENKDLLVWYKFIEKELEEEDKVKLDKKKAIQEIATLSDQLNLLAKILYKLTEWNENPEIIEARQVYENIQNILNN